MALEVGLGPARPAREPPPRPRSSAPSLTRYATCATLRSAPTDELSDLELTELRLLLFAAFEGAFSDEDWDHTLGGCHFIGLVEGAIVAHASVVERTLHAGDRPLYSGYVEGVAVAAEQRRRGHGEAVMAAAGDWLRPRFELGALSANPGARGLYERLGWRTWPGPTAVLVAGEPRRTPDDDGAVMILETPATPALDRRATLSCDWRSGDVW